MRTITITINKGRHKTQPYSFVIDDPSPGPTITVKERYSDAKACKRGALRKLGIWRGSVSGVHTVQRGQRLYKVTFNTK